MIRQFILLALCLLPTVKMVGLLVPLYSAPSDSNDWLSIIGVKGAFPSLPVLAVINPNNGPGSDYTSDYNEGIEHLQSTGIIVLGYVHTSSGSRPMAEVKADIDTYYSWYKSIDGIFFDEMQNVATGYESYYSQLNTYVKTNRSAITFGNPGAIPPLSYMPTLDHVVFFEDNVLPRFSSFNHYSAYFNTSAIISYGQADITQDWVNTAAAHCEWVYLSNQDGSDPYGTIATYMTNLGSLLNNANQPKTAATH